MHFFNLLGVFSVDGLTDAGRLADWLTCYPKGGQGSRILTKIAVPFFYLNIMVKSVQNKKSNL